MARTICVMGRVADQDDGLGVYTINLIRHLVRQDPDTRYLIVLTSDKNRELFAALGNTEVIVKPAGRKLVWDQYHVPNIAKAHRADIIFNPKFSIPLITRIPCVFVLQSSDWYVNPGNYPWWDNLYIRLAIPLYSRRARKLLAISQHTIDELRKRFTLDVGKCRVTHAGGSPNFVAQSDPAELETFRKRFKLPQRFILTVARAYHTGHKGLPEYAGGNLERLVNAYIQYRNRGGDLPLVIAGTDIESYLRHCGFSAADLDGLHFLGFVPHDEIHCAYHLAECFVLATLCESFGFPILEALATGCPAIVPNTCASPEVAGDAARLVDPRDCDDITAALIEVTSDPDIREQLRARGLERAEQFSWERTAAKTLSVFDEIVPA